MGDKIGTMNPGTSRRSTVLPAAAVLAAAVLLSGCVSVPKELTVAPPDDVLAKRIAKLVAKAPARLGVMALHVESGRRLALHEKESFESASIIKIALLAEAAAEWREARFDLAERWTLSASAVAAGSGILDEFEPGLMPTNRDLLRIMISLSDNTATNSFIERFGAEAVNRRMEELGLPGIRLLGRIPDADREPERWTPIGRITPRDTAEYFRCLFGGMLVDREADVFMRTIFRTQRTKSRIPRLLLGPKENVWAGKSGSMNGVRGDAGVLTTRKGRFVLVVLADRIPDDERDGPAVTRAMGEIAKAIVAGWSAILPDVIVPSEAESLPVRAR
jgi:beta-lactamase class A